MSRTTCTRNAARSSRYLLATLFPLTLALSGVDASALPDEDFEQLYFDEAVDRFAKAHALIHKAGEYHIFYVSGNAGEGWAVPGNEIDFGHATSTDLEHWTVHPPVIPIGATGWKARNVWAPHVIPVTVPIDGTSWAYAMAYSGVDSSYNQQIGIAVSNDLFTWQDLSVASGAFTPDPAWALWDEQSQWSVCRDPYLLELGGEFILGATAAIRPEFMNLGNRGAIAGATSPDGVTWTDNGAPLVINNHWTVMSAPSLVQNPGTGDWHMLYTRNTVPGGVRYLTSSSPTSGWDISNQILLDAESISGTITEVGGAYVYAHVEDFDNQDGLAMRGVRFAPLTWPGDVPTFSRSNALFDNWTLISGDLGAQPTYEDRPGFRSGTPSNVEGRFWINSAEDYAGVFGDGCATCAADESQVGILRSNTFEVTRAAMTLWVGGTASPDCSVALIDSTTGNTLRQEFGLGSDVMTERIWNVISVVGKRVYLEISDQDVAGHVSVDAIGESGVTVALLEPELDVPAFGDLIVHAAPNPAGSATTITFEGGLAIDGSPATVRIYDAAGRLVRSLDAGAAGSATHSVEWNRMTNAGQLAPAGVYFVRVDVAGRVSQGRVTLLR